LEDILYRHPKSPGDLESESDRRYVFPLLKRDDGQAGAANPVGKLLLTKPLAD